MQQMGIRLGYDSLLSRISTGICDNTTQAHRVELQRLGRRADVECQLGDTLSDLKARMARKTAVRTSQAAAGAQCRALLQGKLTIPNRHSMLVLTQAASTPIIPLG